MRRASALPYDSMIVARPSNLTPRTRKRICDAIGEQGLTYDAAAAAAGIKTRTFYYWLQLGREEETGKYRRLWEDVQLARVLFEKTHLQRVVDASVLGVTETVEETRVDAEGNAVTTTRTTTRGDWKASAWLLARLRPDVYAERRITDNTHRLTDGDQERAGERRMVLEFVDPPALAGGDDDDFVEADAVEVPAE